MRWVEFNHQDLPKLAREGWRITFGEDYPYQVVAADDAWKVDVNDSGIDWFDLDLGIEVDGERVALLPILLDLFERARRICRPPHSTRSARTTSSARCRTAASCRSRPPG